MESNDIFVQMPAYRDTELLATVRDLFATARSPERVRLAIAWQYGAGEERLERELRACGRVEVMKIPAAESQGCNWARNMLQRRWAGERYTLFLDSHHRFAHSWDEHTIDLYEQCRARGVGKPIITGYLPPYDPANDPGGRTSAVFEMAPLEREQGMLFRLTSHPVDVHRWLGPTFPASFVSLHFLFAGGAFNQDIPFDPGVYFFADEIAIALRAYTAGYDMYHPNQVLGWHLYDRSTRVTHWADHPGWRVQQEASCARLRELFTGALRGVYGVGPVRTAADYERHIGTTLLDDRIA